MQSAIPIALVVAVLALVLCPLLGSPLISPAVFWTRDGIDWEVLTNIRLPRTLLAFFSGAGLTIAGLLLQTILRTPLATPDTLGVSAGASLGAASAIVLGFRTGLGISGVWLGAMLGAAIFVLAVLRLGSPGRLFSPLHVLLAGLALNSLAVAGVLALQYTSTVAQSLSIARWLMGGFDVVGYPVIAQLAAIVTVGAFATYRWSLAWNLLASGPEWAASRGVDAKRVAIAGVTCAAALTAGVSAVCGPLAFVGLMVPYVLRRIWGADHRVLVPAGCLIGGAFLCLCEMLARSVLQPADVPAGVLTAGLGVPFFLYLLSRQDAEW